MSEVSCRALIPFVEAVRASGQPVDELVAGTPHTIETICGPSNRIGWDDYLVLLERGVSLLGGVGELGTMVRGFPKFMGVVIAIASGPTSLRAIYNLGSKWYGQSLFLSTRAFSETLPDGRIRQTVEILPAYRDSELYFRVVAAFLSAAPSVLGRPDAAVELELQPRRATYTIKLPPGPTLSERLRAVFATKADVGKATDELVALNEEIREAYGRARATNAELADKTRVLETLNGIGHKLVRHVYVRELASDIMELLDHGFRFGGVALYVLPPNRGEPEPISRAGSTVGTPSRSFSLTAGATTVGRLDVWESDADQPMQRGDLLEGLLPWFALALNNALSFESLSKQTRRLAAEVAGRRRAEEQIQRIGKLEALGNLAGSLAHDFNNLLTAVKTYAELALQRIDSDGPAVREIQGILAATDRGAGLTKQILAFSRGSPPVLKPIDLNSMVRGMASLLRRFVGKNVELAIVPTEGLGIVMADSLGLEQAIINLVVNSRDAMPEGGRITIKTSNVDDDTSGAPELGYVTVEVSDTGCGMDPELHSRIFEPFFTTKPDGKGTGLGLAIVHNTVTQSGGSVAVQSKPGEGSCFSIRLPRIAGGGEVDPVDELEPEPAGGWETILLVEDVEDVREGTRQTLEEKGYRVLNASHGEEALGLCESYTESIDLLVTDIGLPGIDGCELAASVESLRSELRGVVYISGFAHPELVVGEDPSSGHVFLPKPFKRSALLSAIRRLLGE